MLPFSVSVSASDSLQNSDNLCLGKSTLTHLRSPSASQFFSRTMLMHGSILRESYSYAVPKVFRDVTYVLN